MHFRLLVKSLLMMAALFVSTCLQAQEQRTEICVDFRVNSSVIDLNYSNNKEQINQIISFLKGVSNDTTIQLLEVSFCGAASPEGSYQINRRLANGRLSSLEKIVREHVYIPDSLITRNDSYIPWEYLKSEVEKSDIENKSAVISILEEEGTLES